MKIAMLGQKRIPSREGGVEIVVEELATRMVKKGHEVTCYNRGGKHVLDKNIKTSNKKAYKGVRLKKCFTIDKKGLAAVTSSFFGTIEAIFSKNEVVHYHAEGPCAWMWLVKCFTNKKVIATIHGLDWQRAKWGGFATKFIKFGEKCAVKYADEIIVLSENVKKYFKDNYNRDTIFIPNGVNKPKISKADLIKKKYKLNKDDYILYLGRIVPEKGIHYLIDAYNDSNVNKKLVIAGSASDTDSYYAELKEKAKNNKNIIFTGFVQGQILEELYSNAYIYCLPSDLEGMPLSLLEAMSYGNCCLTSDIKECTEVIKDKGVTFKKGNIKDLSLKLEKLCSKVDDVKKYKKESQDYIVERYSWDDIVEKTIEVYKEKNIYSDNKINQYIMKIYIYFLLVSPILVTLDRFVGIVGTILTGFPFILGLLLMFFQKKYIKYLFLFILFLMNIVVNNDINNAFEFFKPIIIFMISMDLCKNKEFLNHLELVFKKNCNLIFYMLSLIVILNILMSFFSMGYSVSNTEVWGFDAYMGMYSSSHQAAYRFSLLIIFTVYILKLNPKLKKNIIILLILIFLLFKTGARTPTLLGLFIIFVYIYINKTKLFIMYLNMYKKHRFITILSVLTTLILGVFFMCNTAFFQKMLNRNGLSFDSGRSVIWKANMEYFKNSYFVNKIIGNSLETIYDVNESAIVARIWCHNDFIQILLHFGIIFVVMYIKEFFDFYYVLGKNNKFLVLSLLVILVFVSFYNGLFFFPRFTIAIPILYLIIIKDKEKIIKKGEYK